MRIVSFDTRFLPLGTPKRIWAVSAIHSEAARLMDLHDELFPLIRPGDRLIYHGNYLGYGSQPTETIDELLTFRRLVLSIPGMKPDDIVYLRGGQEEMWQKLTQLQFAPNPVEVLLWILGKGLSNTLSAYGINPHDGIIAAQEGVMSLTRWTAKLRDAIRKRPGHDMFGTILRRAAFTSLDVQTPLLFVNAGINPHQPIEKQGDSFWWGGSDFDRIITPYSPFQKVIRGFDPNHRGMSINDVTATIDGGCGFGGSLACACFNNTGAIQQLIEV